MKYELWEMGNYGVGEVQPLLLNKIFDNFTDAYFEFQKLIKTIPCCIILNKKVSAGGQYITFKIKTCKRLVMFFFAP
jgi:hypothetical protein